MMKPANMLMQLAEENGYTFIHPFDDLDSCYRPGYDCHGDFQGAASCRHIFWFQSVAADLQPVYLHLPSS